MDHSLFESHNRCCKYLLGCVFGHCISCLTYGNLCVLSCAGTQLGDILQGEAEQYQEQYAAAAPSLRAALESTSNGPQEHGSDQSEAGGHTAAGLYDELCPGLSNVEAVQALAWADAVVDRCGVPGASGSQMAILPLICATPTVGLQIQIVA